MKFRRLRQDELSVLETRFIEFLASNTITGPDWEKIKTNKPEQAEGLIEIFSDIVFEDTLDKITYLRHTAPTELRCFHCLEEKIIMMGLIAKETKGFDFRENATAQEMMSKVKASGGSLQFFTAEKEYKGDRKQELFRMMENGCLISKGEIYKALEAVAPK